MTSTVTSSSAPGISEMELLKDQRIIGEKENLAPGLNPVSFTATLDAGVPGVLPCAATEYQNFTVTGQAHRPRRVPCRASWLRHQGLCGLRGEPSQPTERRRQALMPRSSPNMDAAKSAYAKARAYNEHAESSVEGFVIQGFAADDNAGNLDYLIDMRESTPVDAKVGWKGFHAIQRDLWQGNAITAATKSESSELVANVGKLQGVVANLQYKPEDLANGAADLIEEVQNTKITGEEEAFSHIDLVDFAANVEGAQQAYARCARVCKRSTPTWCRRSTSSSRRCLPPSTPIATPRRWADTRRTPRRCGQAMPPS